MDEFLQGCQGLGLALACGLAASAIATAVGLKGPARFAFAALAVVGGALLFGASIEAVDHPAWPGWIAGAATAAAAFELSFDVLSAAAERSAESSPAVLAGLALIAAIALAGLSLVVSPVSLLALAAALWLAAARRRRSKRKYEGLRVLR